MGFAFALWEAVKRSLKGGSFTLEDYNADSLHQLSEPLSSDTGRRPIGFIGAGISARAGHPTWAQFLQTPHDLAKKGNPGRSMQFEEGIKSENDVLWRADYYRSRIRESAYYTMLRRTFGQKPTLGDGDSLRDLTSGF
jgi:hypothetical protein